MIRRKLGRQGELALFTRVPSHASGVSPGSPRAARARCTRSTACDTLDSAPRPAHAARVRRLASPRSACLGPPPVRARIRGIAGSRAQALGRAVGGLDDGRRAHRSARWAVAPTALAALTALMAVLCLPAACTGLRAEGLRGSARWPPRSRRQADRPPGDELRRARRSRPARCCARRAGACRWRRSSARGRRAWAPGRVRLRRRRRRLEPNDSRHRRASSARRRRRAGGPGSPAVLDDLREPDDRDRPRAPPRARRSAREMDQLLGAAELRVVVLDVAR